MEADAVLHFYKTIFDRSNETLYLKAIVIDDYSSIRALLKHKITKPKGMFPIDIPELEWLTGPLYRTKVVAKSTYVFSSLSKNMSSHTNIYTIRFKKSSLIILLKSIVAKISQKS